MRRDLRRSRPAKLAAAGAIVVLGGAAAFALASADGDSESCRGTTFDGAAWNTNGDARTREAHRLADCRRLIGMTSAETRTLLGPADERDLERSEICYELGPDALSIDSEFLCIRFTGGKATQTRFFGG